METLFWTIAIPRRLALSPQTNHLKIKCPSNNKLSQPKQEKSDTKPDEILPQKPDPCHRFPTIPIPPKFQFNS